MNYIVYREEVVEETKVELPSIPINSLFSIRTRARCERDHPAAFLQRPLLLRHASHGLPEADIQAESIDSKESRWAKESLCNKQIDSPTTQTPQRLNRRPRGHEHKENPKEINLKGHLFCYTPHRQRNNRKIGSPTMYVIKMYI